ncbi:amino acid transporter [Striga asiatica]|uniref:Amino acid transporter n=1 Tax=Striga asiatica TaxID=4170 RepID=A0A5A7RAP7_STRAF|nr:amino acid transporter [Striga asiatica]
MDMYMYTSMTPPTVSFLKKSSSFLNNFTHDKNPQHSLFEPFVSSSTIILSDDEERSGPTSTLPIRPELIRSSLCELPEQCSYTQSVLNAVNALCGIGILSTPYALKEGGWLSLLLLFLFGIITCYTGILLKRCLDSSSQLQTYPDIGQAAFGLTGRMCIAAILYVELYSSCVEFLIVMSDNLSASFPNIQMDFAGIHLDSYQICAICSTIVILPTVWLRNLSLLSYVSLGGVVTLALVVFCLLWVGVASDLGFHPSGRALNFSNIPIAIGAFSISFGASYQVVAPVTKFALSITPVALSIEELLPESYLRSHGTSIMIRTSLVVSTLIVALTVPYFGSVMALIGSFLVMLVSVVLPCACYMRIDRGRLNRLEIATCSIIIVMGVVCAVVGTCSALKSMSG